MAQRLAKVVCPYCGARAELIDSGRVYSRSYGPIWACLPCRAWVGVHRNSPRFAPLGRLADAGLRRAKVLAHDAFDPFWQAAVRTRGWSQDKARSRAYAWLARQMGIPVGRCHIGHFTVEQCQRVIAICRSALSERRSTTTGEMVDNVSLPPEFPTGEDVAKAAQPTDELFLRQQPTGSAESIPSENGAQPVAASPTYVI